MSLPNKDEVEGKLDQAKGAIKETVGNAVGNKDMEDEGTADRASGNVQEGYGEAKRTAGDAVKDVGDAIKK
ncbi:MAG: CsbD family protein [Pyrinomonadaceae bacterium]